MTNLTAHRPISVIIPAFNAQATIAQTVRAAAALPGVSQVIVVDDGSHDQTAAEAEQAGAGVLRLARNQGKGAALRRGLDLARTDLVLFLDADLGESAALAAALVPPVACGQAAMTIAHLVPPAGAPAKQGGGFGLVVRLARGGIRALTGLTMQSPLSGQRCLHRDLARQEGLAGGFGVEVSLTLEVARRGGNIVEVPLPMTHAVTGSDLAGFLHRGRQFWEVLKVLVGAAYGLGWPTLRRPRAVSRFAIWLLALAGLVAAAHYSPLRLSTLALTGIIIALALVIPFHLLLSGRGQRRAQNYFGLHIPTSFGRLFVITWLILAYPAFHLLTSKRSNDLPFELVLTLDLGVTLGMCLIIPWFFLGVWDDRSPAAHTRGFRGHLRALFRGRLTTGAAKLLFGGLASLVAGFLVSLDNWHGLSSVPVVLLNGLLIALCTNFINLLDLRPGRALKGFFMLGIIAWWINPGTALLLIPLFAAAVVYAPLDLGARAMMGDAGSNVLGAAAGLALALSLGIEAKLAVVFILVAVHIYAEVASLSALIERVPPLRCLDRLGRAEE